MTCVDHVGGATARAIPAALVRPDGASGPTWLGL